MSLCNNSAFSWFVWGVYIATHSRDVSTKTLLIKSNIQYTKRTTFATVSFRVRGVPEGITGRATTPPSRHKQKAKQRQFSTAHTGLVTASEKARRLDTQHRCVCVWQLGKYCNHLCFRRRMVIVVLTSTYLDDFPLLVFVIAWLVTGLIAAGDHRKFESNLETVWF